MKYGGRLWIESLILQYGAIYGCGVVWGQLNHYFISIYFGHNIHTRCIPEKGKHAPAVCIMAAYLSKQDCEFACDEAAVALLGPRERIPYGRTLVGLVAVKAKPDKYFHSMFIASTMMGGRNMKQRIQRIAQKPKTVLSVCLLAVFLSVVCFVSASTAKPAKKVPVSAKESGTPDKDMDAKEASARKMDASKVSVEGEDENPPAGGDVEGHAQVKEPDGKQAVFDLDEAVGQAVLAHNEDACWKRECAAQGHQILDYVQTDGQVTVYALTMYGEYGFNDGYFRNCRKIKLPFILTNYNISITMFLSHSGG